MDARNTGIRLAAPVCYARFLVNGALGKRLLLHVRDGPLSDTGGWRSVFYDDDTWQLWCDEAGRQVFVPPRGSPPRRQIAVDTVFRGGEVTGEFGAIASAGEAIYPLRDIDMAIVANWLAESGDLIVHAAGIDDDGDGYAFVGPSGAGKSTLAALLSTDPSVNVLGEDQVIIRCLKGRFVVYGTPWHTNPARCSPGGVPLTKLFFLDRATRHGVQACGRRDGIERLLQDAVIPYYNRTGVSRILDTLSGVAERIPFYILGFQIGADVMKLIRKA